MYILCTVELIMTKTRRCWTLLSCILFLFSILIILSLDLLFQDRLTISPEIYPNLGTAIRNIYKDGGIGAFYAGLSPTLVGMLPYSTCYYFMYDTIKKSYCLTKNKKSLNRLEMLMIGALSGEIFSIFLSVLQLFGLLCPIHDLSILLQEPNNGMKYLYLWNFLRAM